MPLSTEVQSNSIPRSFMNLAKTHISFLRIFFPFYLAPLDNDSSLCYEVCKESDILHRTSNEDQEGRHSLI